MMHAMHRGSDYDSTENRIDFVAKTKIGVLEEILYDDGEYVQRDGRRRHTEHRDREKG